LKLLEVTKLGFQSLKVEKKHFLKRFSSASADAHRKSKKVGLFEKLGTSWKMDG
jgi:hypothetical protein